MPTFGSTGTGCGLGGAWFCIGSDSVVSADVHGCGAGCTASIGFCEGVLANLGVDVTLSMSSSISGCSAATCCGIYLPTDGADDRGADIAGLIMDTGLEFDLVGAEVVDGGLEIGISSSVTFCCEKRVDAEVE